MHSWIEKDLKKPLNVVRKNNDSNLLLCWIFSKNNHYMITDGETTLRARLDSKRLSKSRPTNTSGLFISIREYFYSSINNFLLRRKEQLEHFIFISDFEAKTDELVDISPILAQLKKSNALIQREEQNPKSDLNEEKEAAPRDNLSLLIGEISTMSSLKDCTIEVFEGSQNLAQKQAVTVAKAAKNLNHAFFSQGTHPDTLAKSNDDENSLLREPLSIKDNQQRIFFSSQLTQMPQFEDNQSNSLSHFFPASLTQDPTEFNSRKKLKITSSDLVLRSTQNQNSESTSMHLDKCLSPIRAAKSPVKIVHETIAPFKEPMKNKNETSVDSSLFGTQSTPIKTKSRLIAEANLLTKEALNVISSDDEEVDDMSNLSADKSRVKESSSSSSSNSSSSSFISSNELSSIFKSKKEVHIRSLTEKKRPKKMRFFFGKTARNLDFDELKSTRFESMTQFFSRSRLSKKQPIVNNQPIEKLTDLRVESKNSSNSSNTTGLVQNDRSIPSGQNQVGNLTNSSENSVHKEPISSIPKSLENFEFSNDPDKMQIYLRDMS